MSVSHTFVFKMRNSLFFTDSRCDIYTPFYEKFSHCICTKIEPFSKSYPNTSTLNESQGGHSIDNSH